MCNLKIELTRLEGFQIALLKVFNSRDLKMLFPVVSRCFMLVLSRLNSTSKLGMTSPCKAKGQGYAGLLVAFNAGHEAAVEHHKNRVVSTIVVPKGQNR